MYIRIASIPYHHGGTTHFFANLVFLLAKLPPSQPVQFQSSCLTLVCACRLARSADALALPSTIDLVILAVGYALVVFKAQLREHFLGTLNLVFFLCSLFGYRHLIVEPALSRGSRPRVVP